VMEEVKGWQSRPLEAVYPVVYMDALYVKVRDNGVVQNRAIHVAIAIRMDGCKEVLGLWSTATEGAKFWLQVLNDLKNRGVQDIFIACVDGLKGFPEAIESAFPKTQVQLCIVHLVRASMQYVNWKLRKTVAADLRRIYTAPTAEAAEAELEQFERKWENKHPAISQIWRRNWSRITPFFAFAPDIRKVIYTTNAIESLNMTLRKVIKTRASFPTDEAATKLLYMALLNVSKKWNAVQSWREALNQFQIMWPERMPAVDRC
jgi:putative transposase